MSTHDSTTSDTSSSINMKIDPARAASLAAAYGEIATRVHHAASGRKVRIVAVSKLKPATDILALHQSTYGVLHFGENYAQELTEKAQMLPRSIRWHFIGGLQSNKCKALASSIPNLYCVSSVDSIKKATQLDHGRAQLATTADASSSDRAGPEKLHIHIQINTSGEESKSGVEAGSADAVALTQHVLKDCPHLHLLGFMTIGAIARSMPSDSAAGEQGEGEDSASSPAYENPDFTTLRRERDRIAREVGRDVNDDAAGPWELSMGMSADFEAAIAAGSGEVRVGSTLFGERPARQDFKVKEQLTEEKA